MDKEIKVSIILSTWKEPKFIASSIDSVLAQSFQDWELLIIDDGLTDNLIKQKIEEYIKKDNRIFFIKHEVNLGLQKTLNEGILMSRGDYIARIDDDDEWIDKDKLKKQIEFLDNHKDFGLVGVSGVVVVNDKNQEMFKYNLPESDSAIRKKILSKNCFIHSGVVFVKKIAKDLGQYSEGENAKHIEDYDLWLKIGSISKFYNIPGFGVKFMLWSKSISSENKFNQLKKNLSLIRSYKYKYPNYYIALYLGYIRLFFYKIYRHLPYFLKNIVFKFYKELV